jgi:CDP-glycerol glycerophosphotransferase (TagB/SpsB family)
MPFKLNPTTNKLDYYNNEASDINYDNVTSGLLSTNVQDGINELNNQNFKFQYPVNTWSNFNITSLTVTSSTFTANQIRARYGYVREKVKIDRVRVTTTTPSPSGAGIIGIYYFNPVTLQATLVAQALGTINLTLSNTNQELLFASEITLNEGIYLFATLFNNTANLRMVRGSEMMNGYSPTITDAFANVVYFNSTYTGTFPSSFVVSSALGDQNPSVHTIFKITG